MSKKQDFLRREQSRDKHPESGMAGSAASVEEEARRRSVQSVSDQDRKAPLGGKYANDRNKQGEQVQEMIEAARAARVPFAWFTADEEFGQNPGLCAWLERERLPYVMAIPKNTTLLDNAGTYHTIETSAQQLPRNTWQRRACGIGAKGHRVYDWALIESTEPDRQYLIRRSITDKEHAYYRCYNPNGPDSPNSST